MAQTHRASTGKQIVFLTGIQVWNQAVNLLKTMVLSRVFSLDEYGTYAKMILVLDFFFAIVVLNLPSAANYFIAKSDSEASKRNFLYTYYILCTAVGILMGSLLYLGSPLISNIFHNTSIMNYRWYLGFVPLFQIIMKAKTYVLAAEGKSKLVAKISLIYSAFVLGSLWIISRSNHALGVCLGSFFALEGAYALVGYFIAYRYTCHEAKAGVQKLVFDKKVVAEIYKYIVPVGLSSLILVINTKVDKIFVSLTSSDATYALYTNASKELPVAIISTALSAVMIPKIVTLLKSNDKDGAIKIWRHTFGMVSWAFSLLLIGTVAFAPEVMTLLYSAKYLEGLTIFRIYLFLIPFHCINYGMLLNAFGKTNYLLKCSVISLVLNIALDFLGYFTIGLPGLGLATVVSAAVMAALEIQYSAQLLGVTVWNLIPVKKLLAFAAANLFLCGCAMLAHKMLNIDLFIGGVGEAILLGFICSGVSLLIHLKQLKAEWSGLNAISSTTDQSSVLGLTDS